MENNLNFSEVDNKIRRNWLFWVIKVPAVFLCVFSLLVIVLMYLIRSGGYSDPKYIQFADRGIEFLIDNLIFVPIFLYIGYRSAYKKQGTIWLLIAMIFGAGDVVLNLYSSINIISMLNVFYELIQVYCSYKLLGVNKACKRNILTTSSMYVNAASIFSSVKSLDELNQEFVKLQATVEPGIEIEALALAYETRKGSLINSLPA